MESRRVGRSKGAGIRVLMPCPANRFDHNPIRAQSVCASFHRLNMQHKKVQKKNGLSLLSQGKRWHTSPDRVHTLFLPFHIDCNCRQRHSRPLIICGFLRLQLHCFGPPSVLGIGYWLRGMGYWLRAMGYGLFLPIRERVRALTSRRQPDVLNNIQITSRK